MAATCTALHRPPRAVATTASIEASCNAAIANKFLTDILANGPVLKTEIEEAANNGIAERTLFRAKNELSIRAEKKGQSGQWQWRLPEAPKNATAH